MCNQRHIIRHQLTESIRDFAIFDPNLETSYVGIVDPKVPDYPTTLTIGPSYFESYLTLPGTKFVHGYDLGRNSSEARAALLKSVPFACKALSNDNLLSWQLGNEPDLFERARVRPTNWTESDYVQEWSTLIKSISSIIASSCPSLPNFQKAWCAPSFAGITSNNLTSPAVFQAGLNRANVLSFIDFHNYIDGANQPGVTLADTLMNHTRTAYSIGLHLANKAALAPYAGDLKYILGETNSLYNQGRPGLSNTFGAALWGLDFNLYCAANNISRVHMHQGTNYRYASWQPVTTAIETVGTRAPYYGNVAVAASLGDLTASQVRVKEVPLKSEQEAAYAAYNDEVLKRLTVVNMRQYNYTTNGTVAPRPVDRYVFSLPRECEGKAIVQRLLANGSDATTGVTFNGLSYNYELDLGRPVVQTNVTRDEEVDVGWDGRLCVEVPWSSAAVVQLDC